MEWVSTKDRLPHSFYSVLVWVVGGPMHYNSDYPDIASYDDSRKAWFSNDGDVNDCIIQVSHWCEIPNPKEI